MEKIINLAIDRILNGITFWSSLPWILLLCCILGIKFILKRKKFSLRFKIKMGYKRQ
jgi:hypothetical protein